MKNIIKSKEGSILPLVIIIATAGIILFTAMADLALKNYTAIRASSTRSNAYYVADFGMERVIKNIETIVESAKIYANEKLRMSSTSNPNNSSDYDMIMAGTTTMTYQTQFENYYKYYINNVAPLTNLNTTYNYVSFNPQIPGLPKAKYSVTVDTASFNTNYNINITIVGANGDIADTTNDTFKRTVVATVGINPWGYDSNTTSNNSSISPAIQTKDNAVYASPQWSNALASSGDIKISGGPVTVEGDVYVNGSMPRGKDQLQIDPITGLSCEGSLYGGLKVGDETGTIGTLTVNGNIFTNNIIHTMYPGSNIQVTARPGITSYASNIGQIYNNTTTNPLYSEKASNLNSNGGDPLNIGSQIINSIGAREKDTKFINYFKDTYGIQKQNGGFVYASAIEAERPSDVVTNTADQLISIDGSVALYDNLQIDSKGTITVSNNFYGFKDSLRDSNDSSSIVTNNAQGNISIQGRVYDAGTAFVTAFQDLNSNGIRDWQSGEQYYQTGEAISLYKNFYSYRTNVNSVTVPVRPGDTIPSQGIYTETYPTVNYAPFNFLNFGSGGAAVINRITHVLAYNNKYVPPEPNISQGGQALDKGMILLNGTYYSDSKLPLVNDQNADMGYSEGILMGTTNQSTGQTFIGFINNESLSDSYGFINYYKSRSSLTRFAFDNYIAGKYRTIAEVKVLKYDFGTGVGSSTTSTQFPVPTVYLDELVDISKISGWHKYYDSSGLNANYIVADGGNVNITVDATGNYATIDYGGTSPLIINRQGNTITYNGLILSTGKITIDNESSRNFEIDGAVVSASAATTIGGITNYGMGIEFKGPGTKKIVYKKDIMINIFNNPFPDSKAVKSALTSRRGIVEIFKKVYARQKYLVLKGLAGDKGFYDAVNTYASDNSISLSSNTVTMNITDDVHGTIPVDVPVAAIEAVANLYEIYDPNKVNIDYYNDEVILFKSVIDQLQSQSNTNYRIITWGATP